jgi:phosphate transport system protein
MGDHATNIAEVVYFMVEGQMLPDDRPKGDITTSISAPIGTERKIP